MKTFPNQTIALSLLFALTLPLGGCSQDPAQAKTGPAESRIEDISVADAAELLESDATVVVLDIRTPGEFAVGHIKGAINIDFNGDDFKSKIAALDKSAQYLMHCQSGGRSGKSLAMFKELGFAHVRHLKDGMGGWQAGKHPVEK